MKAILMAALILTTEGILAEHPLREGEKHLGRRKIESEQHSFESEDFFSFLNSSLRKTDYEEFVPKEYKDYFELREKTVWDFLTMPSSLTQYYLPTNTDSVKCKASLGSLILPKNFGFTIRMADSWGKFPDGILWGNYNPLGMYEECLRLHHDSLQGRYCWIQLIKGANKTSAQNEQIQAPDLQIANVFGEGFNFGIFSYGTCMPSSCTEGDMKESITAILESSDLHISYLSCQALSDKETLTGGDISLIVFLSILCLVLFVATALDLYSDMEGKHYLKEGHLRKLMAFSLSTNFRKLFNVSTSPPRGSISCLNGMRVFSMIWVIYGHQNIITVTNMSNFVDILRQTNGFLYQIIENGTFSVDSFFFISGLLVAYLTFKAMSKSNGKINLVLFYSHRYLRLTPAIAMTAWFQATLARFLVGGPYAVEYNSFVNNCRNKWWTDVLYVNNYAVDPTEPGKQDCIPQAWYTAVDTQIFIFMPLVLIPLYNYRKWGKIWFAFLTLASCIIPASITVGLDLPPFQSLRVDRDTALQLMNYIYAAPFSRAGPYFIGIWVGYFIYTQGDKPLKLKKWQVALGWFFSTALSLTILFGIWKYNVIWKPKMDWTPGMQFFYGGFSRTIWAVSLAWIVIACHFGYGGPVNWFLSHPLLQPLSKLTYTMFLMGMGVQYMITFSNKQLFYFSHVNKIIETCGALFFIGIAATILSLLTEVPIANLEKEILRKPVSEFAKKKEEKPAAVKLPNDSNNNSNSEVGRRYNEYSPP